MRRLRVGVSHLPVNRSCRIDQLRVRLIERSPILLVHGGCSDGSMPGFFPVTKDGTLIGKVTSACISPRLEKNIGYAMVPVEPSELGAQLLVERPDERADVVVADRVFFKSDHAKEELTAGSSPAAGPQRPVRGPTVRYPRQWAATLRLDGAAGRMGEARIGLRVDRDDRTFS